jgi:hypothetical protein
MATSAVDQITGNGETVAYKAPVRLATTGNIALSGLLTVDGVVTVADDRVGVIAQTDQEENGIYIVSSGVWRRARDFDSSRDITKGTRFAVTDGATLAGFEYRITTANPISIGTSSIVFARADLVGQAALEADRAEDEADEAEAQRILAEAAAASITIGGQPVTPGATGLGILATGTSAAFFLAAGMETANANVVVGSGAAAGITSGSNSVAVGKNALNAQTTGGQTTAVGFEAATELTTGTNTTVFGYRALFKETVGNNNAVFGYRGMFFATGGCANNVALGYGALHGGHNTEPTSNFTGDNNTAVGFESMYYSATGTGNVAVGMYALNGSDNRSPLTPTNSASRNVAVGFEALQVLDTGNDNTVVGYQAGEDMTTGSNNVLIGEEAGSAMTTGSRNTLVGSDTHALLNGDDNIVIGYGASCTSSANSNQMSIGNLLRGNLSSKFLGVTDGAAAPATALHVRHATPIVRIQDNDSAGAAAVPQIQLYDSSVRVGFFGKASSGNAHISIINDQAGGDILLEPGAGGSVVLPASTTSGAPLSMLAGTAPTSPVNGDIWFDGTDLKMRVGGVTKTFTLA